MDSGPDHVRPARVDGRRLVMPAAERARRVRATKSFLREGYTQVSLQVTTDAGDSSVVIGDSGTPFHIRLVESSAL
jgi:hypothetical protein